MCPIPKDKCQQQITFTPNQFHLKGAGFKNKSKRIFQGTQLAWNKFIKPDLQIATPLISVAVAAKTKNPQLAQTTSNILKSISGGKTLSLIDMHGNALRLRVV